MYLDFYGLNAEPFAVTPDPDFLFLSPCHKEALATLIYGVNQRKGFIVLVGEIGTGKTTVLRSFLTTLDTQISNVHYIFNANLSFAALLATILGKERGIEAESKTAEWVDELQQHLIQEYRHGRTVVLLIDEAHHMPLETLEQLRLLSNLETTKDKLLQIVLAGQPELDVKLDRYELRQLRQRIAVRAILRPLTMPESLAYILHRLRKAAAKENQSPVFSKSALQILAKQSQGYPMVLNILCDNALIVGLGYHQRPIYSKIVKEISTHYCQRLSNPIKFPVGYVLAAVTPLLIVLLGFVLFSQRPAVFFADEKANPSLSKTLSRKPLAVATLPDMPIADSDSILATAPSLELEPDHGETQLAQYQPKLQPPLEKIVQSGDTMSALSKQIYGYYSPSLLAQLQHYNPQVTPIEAIRAGDKIFFPVLKPGY